MEKWKEVWRAAAPLLSTAGLEKLRTALETDDPRLIQGSTTTPPPLQCVQDWPVEAACLLGFCGWQGEDCGDTVIDVEMYFAETCTAIDQYLQDPAGCRHLLNWFDETPRDEMRCKLICEVVLELTKRGVVLPETELE